MDSFEEWWESYCDKGGRATSYFPVFQSAKAAWQASASSTRKQVVEELGPYCQHLEGCLALGYPVYRVNDTYRGQYKEYLGREIGDCTCGLNAKIREGRGDENP
jgi:hypothetical protein